MRLAVLLVALLSAACSAPAPVDSDRTDGGTTWTRDAFTAEEADTALEFDTLPIDSGSTDTSSADTAADSIPTDTATPDTACWPVEAVIACKTSVPLSTACGERPNGCGGSVTCDACPLSRKCVSSLSTDVGHCGCKRLTGEMCLDKTGAYANRWECAVDDVPLNPLAKLKPQPDGSVSHWCIPTGL